MFEVEGKNIYPGTFKNLEYLLRRTFQRKLMKFEIRSKT